MSSEGAFLAASTENIHNVVTIPKAKNILETIFFGFLTNTMIVTASEIVPPTRYWSVIGRKCQTITKYSSTGRQSPSFPAR